MAEKNRAAKADTGPTVVAEQHPCRNGYKMQTCIYQDSKWLQWTMGQSCLSPHEFRVSSQTFVDVWLLGHVLFQINPPECGDENEFLKWPSLVF